MTKRRDQWMIRLPVVIILVLVGVIAVNSNLFSPSVIPSAQGSQKYQNVSIIQLIANPEKYHGQGVRVKGVGNLEFEGDSISLSQEDWKYHLGNRLWLELGKEISYTEAKQYNGQYVIIEGIFDQHDTGHLGMFYGAIKNITRYEPWDVYRSIAVQITQELDQSYSYLVKDYKDRVLHEEKGLGSFPKQKWLSTDIVGISVSLGTGKSAVQTTYYDLENSYVSPVYDYVLTTQGNYVLYAQHEDNQYSVVVQHIFFPSLYTKIYPLQDVSPIAGDFVSTCSLDCHGNAQITYLSGEDYSKTQILIPFPR
ncbi:MAG: hypothetical protein IJP04_00530 [Clostridia bacterium]|nr:hypothetical protein [Clostridia bacterium]